MNDIKDDRAAIFSVLGENDAVTTPTMPPALANMPDDIASAFAAAVRRNDAECVCLPDLAALPAAMAAFLTAHNAPLRVVCEEAWVSLPWAEVGVAARFAEPVKDDICGVTGVSAAAADNGAMLLTGEVQHRLRLSLVPMYHVAVVERKNLQSNFADIFRHLPSPLPARLSVVCGPSRTADIEQTLTLGVHGPVAVLVALVA